MDEVLYRIQQANDVTHGWLETREMMSYHHLESI